MLFRSSENDIIVIPEICADNEQLQKFKCKKIVFVQNAFYIYEGLKTRETYESLGISYIFYYMPHLEKILKNITNIPLFETPPFIAPYFFEKKDIKRTKKIILYPKFENKEYYILKRYLNEKANIKTKGFFNKMFSNDESWELVELKDKKHKELPSLMQSAMFFVTINTTEAFNSAVPEAMASGCINYCFEDVGPSDFLINNHNAFVFYNDHIFELAEKLVYYFNNYESIKNELNDIRNNAYLLSKNYTIDKLESKIIDFFKNLI